MAKRQTISSVQGDADLMRQFGEPFAQALAVFVSELRRRGVTLTAESPVPPPRDPSDRVTVKVLGTRPETAKDRAGADDAMTLGDDDMSSILARRIAAAIGRSGVSQKEIARRLDVDPSSISRILRQPQHSRLSTLMRVARAAGVQVAA